MQISKLSGFAFLVYKSSISAKNSVLSPLRRLFLDLCSSNRRPDLTERLPSVLNGRLVTLIVSAWFLPGFRLVARYTRQTRNTLGRT